MSEETLKKQIEKHGFSIGDINYIVNYMVKEGLSPQLAMRRIKSYDALEKKMGQKLEADRMKIDHLSKELEIKTQALEEANKKLEELGQARQREDEIRNSLESKSEMLDAELEELKNQLQMIQIMQADQPSERSPETEAIAKSINHIINEVKMIIIEYEEVTTLYLPIVTALTEALADPEGFVFSPEDLIATIEDFILLNSSAPPTQNEEDTPQPVTTAAPRSTEPPISPPTVVAPTVSTPESPPSSMAEPADELEDVVPSWKTIEEKKEEPKPEPLTFKPTDLIKKHEKELTEPEDADESVEEEVQEETPTTGQLTPSQIIKQRQKALAEREAKRREEEAKIEALKQAAVKKEEVAKEKAPEEEQVSTQVEVSEQPVEHQPKTVSRPEPIVEPKPEPKPESRPEPKTKPKAEPKPPVEEKPKVDNKVKQVLLTFKDFINEAKSTKNFNDRIKLISDQDAAYEVLGGIGLSQMYSYATKPIQMKDELLELLDTWIENGPPR